MLDARADVWDTGQAPSTVIDAIEDLQEYPALEFPELNRENSIILGGELALIKEKKLSEMLGTLQNTVNKTPVWVTPTGSVEYILGARERAHERAEAVVEGISKSGVKKVIADSPETAWMLKKVYPAFGLKLPEDLTVTLLSETLTGKSSLKHKRMDQVFLHDSRSAYLIAEGLPSHQAVLPGYLDNEEDFGSGSVYDAPRQLLDSIGCERVSGTWIRALAKSCGSDDGLWLTYPDLASGLANQRLDYITGLGVEIIVCGSPLCASYLKETAQDGDIPVYWLPELLAGQTSAQDEI